VTEQVAHDRYRLASCRRRDGRDVGHSLADLLGEREEAEEQGLAESAEWSAGTSVVSNAGTGYATTSGHASGARGVYSSPGSGLGVSVFVATP
jgi:hypothetical protein